MKTKNMVTAALLTALSLLFPLIFPRLELGPFSATFASHVPLFVAMYVSPVVAVAAGVGSTLGFFMNGVPPYIVARAAMHIIIGLIGAVMIKKNLHPAVVGGTTLIFHAVLETLAVIPFMHLLPAYDNLAWYQVILYGTAIHHVIDYVIAFFVQAGLKRARVI